MKVCSPPPAAGVTGLLVPAAMYPPVPLGRRTRRANGPPAGSCILQRTIAPVTGEVKLAPFSGSAALKKVLTCLNSVATDPVGRTLPTVTVDACAAVASSAHALIAATARTPSSPNIPCLVPEMALAPSPCRCRHSIYLPP